MASPLDILGGLGQIGGLGAIGAYQGEIEGKKLQKDFETRDLENQMRMLRNLQMGQQINQPEEFVYNNMILRRDPKTGQITPIAPLPIPPPQRGPMAVSPGQSVIDPMSGRTLFSVPAKPERPVSVPPGGALVDPTTGRTITEREPKAPTTPWGGYVSALKPATPEEYLKAVRDFTKMQRTPPGTSVGNVTMTGPDGKPWVFERRVSQDPETGEVKSQYTPVQPSAEKATAAEGKRVGEMSRPMVNRNGEYAPAEMGEREAAKGGYFQVTPKEESLLIDLPGAIKMHNNLVDTAVKLRDAGGFRTKAGIPGMSQRLVLGAQKFGGDVTQVGGLLTQWEGLKSELYSLYRRMGEKGNLAARIAAPQLEAMSPGSGFPAVIRQLSLIEKQLFADVRASRLAGSESKLQRMPELLPIGDQRYGDLRKKGLDDKQIEQQFGVIVVP